MNESLVLQTIIFALVAGALCQALSERLKTPSIFFLLVAGMLLGPDFLDWVRPSLIEGSFTFIIEIGVAIILFEGGLSLRMDQFNKVSEPVRRLLTIGALITMVGATLSARWILGIDWKYATVFGALMIVTGPTVISPILKRVRLKKDIAAILNWESILLDPIGAILALLIVEFIVSGEANFGDSLIQFLKIIFVGSVVGLVWGRVLIETLRRFQTLTRESVSLLILAGALLSFETSELLANNAGMLAVVMSGIIVGNGNFKHKDRIEEFKGTLASLWIGFLFVLLAARLHYRDLLGLGQAGIVFLGAMLFVVRPLNIFLSTIKTSLHWREKLYLSWTAPRGIVAAAVASLFVLIFKQEGFSDAKVLEQITYLVIIATVVLQGMTARPVSRLLRVYEKSKRGVLVIGAHVLARRLAVFLKEKGIEVLLVDTNNYDVQLATESGLDAYRGNALEPFFLQSLPIERIGRLLALTSNNEVNMLASQLGNKLFGEGAAYQILPRKASYSHELAREVGGISILPELTYLDRVNRGLDDASFQLAEETVSRGFMYNAPVHTQQGLFWPLLFVREKKVIIIPAGHEFKTDEKVVGLLQVQET